MGTHIRASDEYELMINEQLKNIIEAALYAAEEPLNVDRLLTLFTDEERPSREQLGEILSMLEAECATRGVELVEVGSGYRFQARQELSPWLARLWEERPPRYSRALLETLSLIAYRQPVTRGEIEEVRGVAVSTTIIKTLLEREWIRSIGHRDVPGKPALYATTRQFLDHFSLASLDQLPRLAEIRGTDTDMLLALESDTVVVPPVDFEASTDTQDETAARRNVWHPE